MTRTSTLALVAGLACLLGGAAPAAAQVPGGGTGYSQPFSRPYVSPYLNLLRGGANNAGFNYFTLVRPQINAQTAINQLSFQAGQNQQAIANLQQGNAAGSALVTGHAFGFMTHGGYFQNFSGGAGPGFSSGVGGGGAGMGGVGAGLGGPGLQGGSRGGAGGGINPPRRGR